MNYIIISMVFLCSIQALAMQRGSLDLVKLAQADIAKISLTNPLVGDHNVQRHKVKAFAGTLTEVIIADGQGNYDVDMDQFRAVVREAALALPIKEGEQPMLAQPIIIQAQTEGNRLWKNLSGKTKLGLYGIGAASIFFAGVIYGWWKATDMHAHHAPTGGQ